MTVATVAERVARGAKLLDTKEPGWFKLIDVSILNIADPFVCVAAQLYGDFDIGAAEILDAKNDALVEHGFYVICADGPRHAEYAALTEAWKSEIEQRLAADMMCKQAA